MGTHRRFEDYTDEDFCEGDFRHDEAKDREWERGEKPVRRRWVLDGDHDAHVADRDAAICERAKEAVFCCGVDPRDWNIADDVADCLENGIVVQPVEIAYAMLNAAQKRIHKLLDEDGDADEVLQDNLAACRACLVAIMRNDEGGRVWSTGRDFLFHAGVRLAFEACRIHDGGTGKHVCAQCQASVLTPTLVASVAVAGARKAVA